MNKTPFMKRRTFMATASLAIANLSHSVAKAQSLPPFSVPALVEQLSQRSFLDQVYADVFFLYSWRIQIAPRGYENEQAWQESARNFVSIVFNQVSRDPGAMVSASESKFQEFHKQALLAYEKNAEDFDKFVAEIGIASSGQAATRLKQSMQSFLALAVASNDADVPTATRSSYFWPFC